MSKRENGLAVKEANNLKFTSATDLLQEWSNSLSSIIKPECITTDETDKLKTLSAEQGNLSENIQRLILDEMIGRSGAKDKEQFIRMVQIMVTRLLDSVSIATESNPGAKYNENLLNFTHVLLTVIHFIKDFFGNYFDYNEKIPAALFNIYKKEIVKLNERFTGNFIQLLDVSKSLIDLLTKHFAEGEWMNCRPCNYRHFTYERELLTALLQESAPTDLSIRSLLYYFNFNCSSFVIYEFDRLVEIVTIFQTKSEKVNALRTELKTINQLPARVNYSYDADMPTLKEQVSTWIEEEIKYCEAGHFIQTTSAINSETENKIHTTLSVAKLSLLIRLLVVDKIIINRTVAPMLRTIAKTFSTLQREEISFGSLETKYHAPDKATIAVMKEMLQKWITILGKL